MSHDMEDIIAVVDGRLELLDEIMASDADVRQYISGCFAKLSHDRKFIDAIGMHLLPDEASQARAKIIRERIEAISKLV